MTKKERCWTKDKDFFERTETTFFWRNGTLGMTESTSSKTRSLTESEHTDDVDWLKQSELDDFLLSPETSDNERKNSVLSPMCSDTETNIDESGSLNDANAPPVDLVCRICEEVIFLFVNIYASVLFFYHRPCDLIDLKNTPKYALLLKYLMRRQREFKNI